MDREKYIVYQYLRFIWRKKWFLIGVTIVFMLLGFLYSQRTPASYTGHALVFTGNAENDMLSKPDFISSQYKVTAKVSGPFEVTMDITSNTQQGAETQIKNAANKYLDGLKVRYNEQLNSKKDYANSLKQQINTLKQLSMKITNQQAQDIYTADKVNLPKYRANLAKVKYEIYLMEKPKLMNITTSRVSNNSVRNAILGAAFGFQLILIILVIWKYILDAKRTLAS